MYELVLSPPPPPLPPWKRLASVYAAEKHPDKRRAREKRRAENENQRNRTREFEGKWRKNSFCKYMCKCRRAWIRRRGDWKDDSRVSSFRVVASLFDSSAIPPRMNEEWKIRRSNLRRSNETSFPLSESDFTWFSAEEGSRSLKQKTGVIRLHRKLIICWNRAAIDLITRNYVQELQRERGRENVW